MVHQCLKCGRAYNEGSPELLKGCASCGGTRFFFTQVPLDNDARATLVERANNDIKMILKELVQESGVAVRPDYGDALWSKESWKQWISVTPETAGKTVREYVEELMQADGAVTPARSVLQAVGPAGTGPRPFLQHTPKEAGVLETLEIDVVAETPTSDDTVEVAVDAFVPPDPPAATQTTEPVEAPPAVPIEEEAPPPEARLEVVTVLEPGQYEIDVEALLKDSRIIVQNNGTYLVHLPSLFESFATQH